MRVIILFSTLLLCNALGKGDTYIPSDGLTVKIIAALFLYGFALDIFSLATKEKK